MKSADGGGSSSIAPFLKKCYDMVDDSCSDSIISWSKNGDNSFVIFDTTVFSVQILPKYFKHSNFSSFVRQLNIYVSPLSLSLRIGFHQNRRLYVELFKLCCFFTHLDFIVLCGILKVQDMTGVIYLLLC